MQQSDNDESELIHFLEKNKSDSSDGKASGSFGSLFNPAIIKSDPRCVNKIPKTFSQHFMGIDEFCSTNASSEKDTCSSSFNKVRLHRRSYFNEIKARGDVEQMLNIAGKSYSNSMEGTSGEESSKEQHTHRHALNKEVIAEMDRQYDHNVCLDRFIHEQECRQQQRNSAEKTDTDQTIKVQLEGEQLHQNEPSPDLIDDRTKPASSNGKSENCSNCNNFILCSCKSYTSGSSSLAPRSSESGSQKSNSPKSSTTGNKTNDSTSPRSTKMYNSGNVDVDDKTIEKLDNEAESGVYSGSTSCSQGKAQPTNHKGGKPGRKRKRGYLYDPKPVKRKPAKKEIPETNKDSKYWEKRQRNNEAARKSREMRRRKEIQVSKSMQNLMKENQSLRASICLLIRRNEALEIMLKEYEFSETEGSVENSISTM